MSDNSRQVMLLGRVFVNGQIHAKTGLHIGGSQSGIDIGGIDNYVIRDPLTQQPYIPGSSLKGKVRSLLEKRYNRVQNTRVGRAYIHSCATPQEFRECRICPVFGVSAEKYEKSGSAAEGLVTLTRLVVRDGHLTKESAIRLLELRTEMQYTEVKTEVVIDRLTSAANPRVMERVPAGAEFVFELVFNIYEEADIDRFSVVGEGLQLLEGDYLGGSGSRGSGQVQFQKLTVDVRKADDYSNSLYSAEYPSIAELSTDIELIKQMKTLAQS